MDDVIVSTEYDGKRRTLYKRQCIYCKAEFYSPKHVNSKTCSITCRSKIKSTAQSFTTHCAYCNKPITKKESSKRNSKSGLHFCNRVCKEKAQSFESGILYNRTLQGESTYRKKAIRYYGNICMTCGIDSYNGKTLYMDVHHIDGNRKNNVLANLRVLCPNCHRQEEMNKWGMGLHGVITTLAT